MVRRVGGIEVKHWYYGWQSNACEMFVASLTRRFVSAKRLVRLATSISKVFRIMVEVSLSISIDPVCDKIEVLRTRMKANKKLISHRT